MRSIRDWAWWRRHGRRSLLAFGAAAALSLHFWAVPAVAASAKDCIAFEEGDADDALTYRNDCNRTVFFYYCVVDPQRSEVAPCKRIIFGTRRVPMQGSRGQMFLPQEMDQLLLRHQTVGRQPDQMGGLRRRTRRARVVHAQGQCGARFFL